MGAPTKYTPEIVREICTRLASGESLRKICASPGMVDKTTVLDWLRAHKEFQIQYALAREVQADTLTDEMLDIADDASNDWMETVDEKGQSVGWKLNSEHVQRSRLRIDVRKWYASKLAPKKYGDKVLAELTGADGGPIDAVSYTPRERAKALAALLAKQAK